MLHVNIIFRDTTLCLGTKESQKHNQKIEGSEQEEIKIALWTMSQLSHSFGALTGMT